MFCSECGVEAIGKFCSACGHPIARSQEPVELAIVFTPDAPDSDRCPPVVWNQSLDYEQVLKVPEVRKRIARHASKCDLPMTGEEFLQCCEKLLGSITGGLPLKTIAKITQPLTAKLGIRTGKSRTERLAIPPGEALVAVICFLAEHGYQLQNVEQQKGCCILHSAMPSDMWSLKGDLAITLRAEGGTVVIEATTTIPGQAFDWGKSQRCIDGLFQVLASVPQAVVAQQVA